MPVRGLRCYDSLGLRTSNSSPSAPSNVPAHLPAPSSMTQAGVKPVNGSRGAVCRAPRIRGAGVDGTVCAAPKIAGAAAGAAAAGAGAAGAAAAGAAGAAAAGAVTCCVSVVVAVAGAL